MVLTDRQTDDPSSSQKPHPSRTLENVGQSQPQGLRPRYKSWPGRKPHPRDDPQVRPLTQKLRTQGARASNHTKSRKMSCNGSNEQHTKQGCTCTLQKGGQQTSPLGAVVGRGCSSPHIPVDHAWFTSHIYIYNWRMNLLRAYEYTKGLHVINFKF